MSSNKSVGLRLVLLGVLLNIRLRWWTGNPIIEVDGIAQWLGWILVIAGLVYLFWGLSKQP